MFTGIITELGTVGDITVSDTVTEITVRATRTVDGLRVGDSVAVNGVCLTAVRVGDGSFSVQAVPETMGRTGLGSLVPGSRVNLERPLGASGRFDGHIVQGHIDGVGQIMTTTDDGDSVRIRVSLKPELAGYVVEKGSICVDGTSLTVTAVSSPDATDHWFEFVLIPHTLEVTAFGTRSVGDLVNLEVDVIAKYVERMAAVVP